MKNIMVDAFTFEVARAVDKDLSERMGYNFSASAARQRLVAVLFALKDSGLLDYSDQGRETWFSGPKQILLEQLDESGHVPEDDFVTLAMEYVISFKLKMSEMTRSIELSKQCRVDLDESLVKRSWSELVAKVGLISKGCLHLIGPEAKDGLIFQDRSRSTAEDGQCCVWFSLGGRNKKPFTVDLKKPSFLDDESPIQYPLKSAASASEHGRPFVTLLDFQLAGMLYIFDWPLKGSHEFFTRPILVNSQHC